MAKRQTNEYVYRSDLNIINEVRQNAPELVTSAGIFDKIRQMGTTSLIDSGFVTDCIISIRKNFYLSYNSNTDELKLGDADRPSTYYIPDGLDPMTDEFKFKHITVEPACNVVPVTEAFSDNVVDCEVSLLYDHENRRIISIPNRTNVTQEGTPTRHYYQYIFAQDYEPRTAKTTGEDVGTIWWDTANNVMKEFTAGGWVERDFSLPLAVGYRVNGKLAGIKTDFTVGGFLEQYVWVNTGVQFNFPEGRSTGDDNALICNPLTTGRDSEGHDTYQPIVSRVLNEEMEAEEHRAYVYDAEVPENNLIEGIHLNGICCGQETMKIDVKIVNSGSSNNYTLSGLDYDLEDDSQTITFHDNVKINLIEGDACSIKIRYRKIQENIIEEDHNYVYDYEYIANNTIRFIKLDGMCHAENTLIIKVKLNRSSGIDEYTLDPTDYYLVDDDKTIVINQSRYITLTEGDTCNINIKYYEIQENAPLYISKSMEILNPLDEIIFNYEKGHYENAFGEKVVACKFATMTSGYITPKNLHPNEELTIASFAPNACFTLADGDDIEYLIKLIGSSTGETMNQVLATLQELTRDLDEMEIRHDKWVDDLKEYTDDRIKNECVHLTTPTDWYPAGVETIEGNKKFTGRIEADIEGVASMVNKEFATLREEQIGVDDLNNPVMGMISNDREIRPMGIVVAMKDDGTGNTIEDTDHEYTNADTIHVNTTVRIGNNYVKAELFKGTATQAMWADLAEKYIPDADYPVGTLVRFGGEKEITVASHGIANAVISEKPAYLMNADEEQGVPIALVGKVPVRVHGAVKKFDKLICSDIHEGMAVVYNGGSFYEDYPIIAIALEDNDSEDEKLVMCVTKLVF